MRKTVLQLPSDLETRSQLLNLSKQFSKGAFGPRVLSKSEAD